MSILARVSSLASHLFTALASWLLGLRPSCPDSDVGNALEFPTFTSPGDQSIQSSSILHRSLNQEPTTVIAAEGQYLTLSTGQRIFDACGGAIACCIGHGDRRVASAVA